MLHMKRIFLCTKSLNFYLLILDTMTKRNDILLKQFQTFYDAEIDAKHLRPDSFAMKGEYERHYRELQSAGAVLGIVATLSEQAGYEHPDVLREAGQALVSLSAQYLKKAEALKVGGESSL